MKLFLTTLIITFLALMVSINPQARKTEVIVLNSTQIKVLPSVNLTVNKITEPKAPKKSAIVIPVQTGSYQEMICKRFGKYCNDALIIVKNESGFRPSVISKTGDWGIFQINCYWEKKRQLKYNKIKNFDCNKLLDVNTNIEIAWTNFTRNGYSWKSWTTCKYLTKCY